MTRPFFALLVSTSLLLSGCGVVGLATGAGAVAGITAAKEGGLKSGITDAKIKAQINDLWFKRDVDMFRKLDLTIDQGRVLITGVVQNPEARVEAVRLAWQPKGVKQVINEIRIGDASSIKNIAQDEWITAQLRTRLVGNKDVQSINYSIEVVQGSVFLMGVARNQQELDRVIRIAQKIKGVKEVVSYVKLSGEPITSTGAATSAPGTYQPQASSDPVPVTSDMGDPSVTTYPVEPMPAPSAPASIESEVLPP